MIRMFTFAVALVVALLQPVVAAAQDSNFVPLPSGDTHAPPGWTFIPTILVGTGYDDNLLVRGAGDQAPGDVLSVVNPRGTLDYNSARGQMSATYDGSVLLYRDLNELNSLDQHASFFGRRLISRHVALFVRESAASVPTTELQTLIAVPFVRTGSRVEDLRGGVEAAFSKRTSMVASYDFEWVGFDQTTPASLSLIGGHSNGASASLKHILTAHLTVTGDYDLQHAMLRDIDQSFDIQNAWAGAEYKLSDVTRVFGAIGVSHLGVTQFAESKTGPAWRFGLVHAIRRASVDVLYSRSYVPSYGFGGTTQNEELTGRLQLPLARRVYTTSAASWRQDNPLIDALALTGSLPLRSVWLEGTIGYALSQRIRLELFYAGTHQTIDRPGGELDRNRVGIQVIAAKPVRIR